MAGVKFKAASTTCAVCHTDVHLGQVGADCQSCHSLASVTFAPDRFAHERARFLLTGRHQQTACALCHKKETGSFPSGAGTATRLAGLSMTCQGCHADVHLGQLGPGCEACHTVASFAVKKYAHKDPPRGFFAGRHVSATCVACHKTATTTFPSGRGTAIRFSITAECVSCHTDPHNGSLGTDCGRCHKPVPRVPSHVQSAAPIPEALRRARLASRIRP